MKKPEWLSVLKPYEGGVNRKSIIQLSINLFSFLAIIALMFVITLKGFPYWLIILLSFPAAGFQVRIFIIMHDCGHNSFFNNTKACSVVGIICGIITFTPYNDWRKSHAVHHATVSNLDKRGSGDIWTMTVSEYKIATSFTKFKYRIFRNPLFLFGMAPLFLFLVLQRFPHRNIRKKELISVLFTDFILTIMIIAMIFTVGIMTYLKVFLPIVFIAFTSGTWLFYVQHQFKKVYWEKSDQWDRIKAALKGSSFYKLPIILRWFSGNIGYHHIHHLSPKIPNYNLPACFKNIPELRKVIPLTIGKSFRSLFLSLWDEQKREMINFKSIPV